MSLGLGLATKGKQRKASFFRGSHLSWNLELFTKSEAYNLDASRSPSLRVLVEPGMEAS